MNAVFLGLFQCEQTPSKGGKATMIPDAELEDAVRCEPKGPLLMNES